MKKISTLIALATVATIGSVYATWSYSGSTELTQNFALDGATNVGITDKISAEKGTIAMDRSNFNITIDDANGDYNAEFAATGYLKITYTPSATVSDDVRTNGLTLYFTLTNTLGQYAGVNIFSVDSTAVALGAPTPVNVDPGTGFAEKFTYRIEASDIDAKLSFYTNTYSATEATDDGTLRLDQESEYDAFKVALHNGSLWVEISDTNS